MKKVLTVIFLCSLFCSCYDFDEMREQISENRQNIIDLQTMVGDASAPLLKIEDGCLHVSYDKGKEWEKIGSVSSSTPSPSPECDCECLIESATVSEGYVTIVLSTGVTFTVPMQKGGVRSYYLEELEKTKSSLRELMTGPCLVFPMITDIHYKDSPQCPDLIDRTVENILALSKDIRFDFLVTLGDIVDGNTPKDSTEKLVKHLYDQFMRLDVPYYPCIGNHDDNRYHGDIFTHEQLYRIYMRNTFDVVFDMSSMCGTNYYKDFHSMKIRCVFINANTNGKYGFSEETCSWFEDAVKTDYDLYVFSHISPVAAHQYNQGEQKNGDRIIAAIKGAPTFKMFFNGHCHYDCEFTAPFNDTDNPFLSYTLNCNRFSNDERKATWPSQAIHPLRKLGTASEDCFDIVVIRPGANKVNTVRFGAGVDREFNLLTGESSGESSAASLPENVSLTLDFSSEWPFNEECAATTDQSASLENYTYDYKYESGSKTRAFTFTLGSTDWTSSRVYSYEAVPGSTGRGLYFHGAPGGVILPGIPGMYLSSVSVKHYGSQGKYALQEYCGTNCGNRKLGNSVSSGSECVFTLPIEDASPAPLESESGKPYVLQSVNPGGYIGKLTVVYTKGKPGEYIFDSGSGTEDDPYVIKTVEQWNNMSDRIVTEESRYAGAYYKLGADIDFNNEYVGQVMGFEGVLDGSNYTLLNAKIGDGTTSHQAFFYNLSGTIKNLKFDNITVLSSASAASGDASTSAAVIVAGNNSNAFTLENCHVSNSSVTSGKEGDTYGAYAGGLVARTNNAGVVISNCSVKNTEVTCLTQNAGGFIGIISNGKIDSAFSSGNTINSAKNSGGIAGSAGPGALVINCISENNLCSVTACSAGGVVGANAWNSNSTGEFPQFVNILSRGNVLKSSRVNSSQLYLGLVVGSRGTNDANMVFKNCLVLSGTAQYSYKVDTNPEYPHAACVGIVIGYGSPTVESIYFNEAYRSKYDVYLYDNTDRNPDDDKAEGWYRNAVGLKQSYVISDSKGGTTLKGITACQESALSDGECLSQLNAWVDANKSTYTTLRSWISDSNDGGSPIISF